MHQPALARHDGAFDAEQLAANLRPGKPGDQADFILQFLAPEIETTNAQIVFKIG